jgi:hypothetical protein
MKGFRPRFDPRIDGYAGAEFGGKLDMEVTSEEDSPDAVFSPVEGKDGGALTVDV